MSVGWWSGAQASWVIIKDIILTAGGLTLIMVEVFAVASPSDTIIVTGLAMSGIGASFHVGALVGGFIGKSSGSQSPPPSGHMPSSISQGEPGEHH